MIVSYSWPAIDEGTEDTNTSASIVLNDGSVIGNAQYTASIIEEETGYPSYFLQTKENYPTDYNELIEQVQSEKNRGYKPELQDIPDLKEADRIILVTPNWWADLPRPIYTFLEQEDLKDKTIVPVVVHGGSGFSGILDTLKE